MRISRGLLTFISQSLCSVLLLSPAVMAQTPPAGMLGMHTYSSTLPDGCKPEGHEGLEAGEAPSREAMMQKLAAEFELTGQQQQDLQLLVADYAERLRQIAEQLRDSSEKLATTEPDDPYYWPLAQEVSARASASAGETVILLSELRQKVYQVLTAEQRDKIRQKLAEAKARCQPAEVDSNE